MEDQSPYSLLIIDSIINLFRSDYTGRGELAARQQLLNQHLKQIKNLAESFHLAVYITNQVCADPAGGMSFVKDPKKAVGGHILSHGSPPAVPCAVASCHELPH